VGVALLIGLAVLVQTTVGWHEMFAPWRTLPPVGLAAALALVVGSYAVRTMRVHQYFRPATSGRFPRTFRLVLLHILFNNLLPARSGEASFPVLMKREFGVGYTRSVGALFYLRLLDLHFIVVLAAAVLLTSAGPVGWLVVALLIPIPYLAFRLQERWATRLSPDGWTGRLAAGLPGSAALFWTVFGWTAVNWTVKLAVFAWVLRLFHPMPYSTAVLGSVTGELSSALPIHGVAGAGTYEAGVLASLLPLGLDMESALQAAVNLHLFVLGTSVLSGVLAFLVSVVEAWIPGSRQGSR
jgi:uncharacterized membrane protein YbhN (UPF0104 family)